MSSVGFLHKPVSAGTYADLKAKRPEMATLFLSGYTHEEVVRAGLLEEGTPFLQKPFAPSALLARVQELLGRRAC